MADQHKSATVTVTKHDPAPATSKAETKDAPAQQVVNPGDTVVAATVTLATLVSTLYPTNTAPTPPANYTWAYPGVLQGVYGDQSMVTLRFEARAFVPTVIRTY